MEVDEDESQKRHECDRCPYYTYNKSHVTRHKKCHGNMSNRYVCPHPPCNFRAGNRTNLDNHAKLHTDGKATPISSSGTKTARTQGPQKSKLVIKLFAREKPKAKMKSNEVSSSKITPTPTYRNSKGQFAVKNPQKTTSNPSQYYTSKSKYKCSRCSFQTNHRFSYTRHSAVHDTKRPVFPCPICSKTFSRSDTVSKHLKRSCPGYPPTLADEDDVAEDKDDGDEVAGDEDAEAKVAEDQDAKDEVTGDEDAEDGVAEDKDTQDKDAEDETTGEEDAGDEDAEDEDSELPERDPDMPTTDETDEEQQKENVGQSVTEPTTDLNKSNKYYCEFCSYRAKLSCYFRKHMKPCSACGRKP